MAVFRKLRWFWVLTAMVVTLQLIAAQAMAASPTLHDQCHGHSHDTDHACVVTLILNGGYDCSVPDIVPVTVSSETPDIPAFLPLTAEIVPSRLLVSVLADAPPRGP